MSHYRSWVKLSGLLWLGLILGAGCGKSETPGGGETASGGGTQAAGKGGLPAASIGNGAKVNPDDEKDDADDLGAGKLVQVEPQEGSAEWLIREATRLRLQPPPKTDDVAALRKSRQERNEKIVNIAQQAIALTHQDKAQERLFNVSVHHLMEARLQLALLGDRENIDALYEDVAALESRNPQSAAAAEGAYALVSLAYSHARNTKGDTQWLQEFSNQAKHFAGDYPKDEARSLPLLFTAARSCELHGLMLEARDCYELLARRFPKSAYAPRVTGILRRLKLPGNPPQLGGPTLDGDQVTVDDLLGQVVLVVFWATDAKPFQEQLPMLLAVQRKHAKQGLAVLGINLDQDSTPVNQFVVRNQISWPQVFFPEPERRGWNHPLASFYGVLEIPAYWLIDRQGNVVGTSFRVADLDPEISRLLAM